MFSVILGSSALRFHIQVWSSFAKKDNYLNQREKNESTAQLIAIAIKPYLISTRLIRR